MQTVYHSYCLHLDKPEEKQAWLDLKAKLAGGPHCMESHGGNSHYMPALDGKIVELETTHLFDNQWNTGPIAGTENKGMRVFDWALDATFNSFGGKTHRIKQGHYLGQTAEMKEIRRNTNKCQYCGAMEPAAKGDVFCPHCIDSEYLTESILHLTRMKAIDDRSDCAPLTEAERGHLLPLYREAQLHGTTERGKARLAKQRANIETKFNKALQVAHAEHDGFLWLLDHGMKIDNVIYYSHTGQFCFGWRTPVSAGVRDGLLDIISEFQFPYEIKCEDGKSLEGY